MGKLMLSWSEIESRIDEIDAWLKAVKFKPNVIVGISRGGLVPARLLSDKLGVPQIAIVSASRYTYGKHQKTQGPIICEGRFCFGGNERILIVDDIWDTGETIRTVRSHICEYSVRTIQFRVVTLVSKTLKCPPQLDYAPSIVTPNTWVIFPWDKHEFTKSRRVLPTC